MKNYTVIRDTREKKGQGWLFREEEGGSYASDKKKKSSPLCMGTEIIKLDTGDYTLENFEEVLCIERKGSVSEFAGNTVQDRFERELVRMLEFKYAYVLLEFTMEEMIKFPAGARLPKRVKYKIMKGNFILKRFLEMTMKYPQIHFLFCGDDGRRVCKSIFKRVLEDE